MGTPDKKEDFATARKNSDICHTTGEKCPQTPATSPSQRKILKQLLKEIVCHCDEC